MIRHLRYLHIICNMVLLLVLLPPLGLYCPWKDGGHHRHHAVAFGFTTIATTTTTTTSITGLSTRRRTTTGRLRRPLLLLHDNKSTSSSSTTTSAANNEFAQVPVLPSVASTTSNNETKKYAAGVAVAAAAAAAATDGVADPRDDEDNNDAVVAMKFYPPAEEAEEEEVSYTASAAVAVIMDTTTTTTTTTTSTTSLSLLPSSTTTKYPQAEFDIVSLWKRRLITQEDPFSIHKISSITYTLSAMIILGTGLIRYVQSPETWSTIPTSLTIPTYVFALSNVLMCAISVRMAFVHRRYDLTARNGFLGVASSSMFSGFYFLWTNPLGPTIFNNQVVTQVCFALFVILDVYFVVDTLQRIPDVVESRRDKKVDDYHGRFVIDTLGYVLPVIWGLPFILPTAYLDAILYNRSWFFEQCHSIDQTLGVVGMLPCLCYLQVALSLAASYGALFVTLRDKKLITKNQELVGITAFSVPALLWTIYGTYTFFSNISEW